MGDIQQISMFDNQDSVDSLQIAKLSFLGSEFMSTKQLFNGFDNLYAITFSYGLSFIDKVSRNFQTIDIILGCEALAKYDVKEIMAFQKESLILIRRHSYLVNRVDQGEIHFYLSHAVVAHEKIYLLTTNDGKRTRVIIGSANFSGRSFSGEQKETIALIDNEPEAFEYFMREFESLKKYSTTEVVHECLYVKKGSDENDVNPDQIPFLREAISKENGLILDNKDVNPDRAEYLTEVRRQTESYKSVVPKIDAHGTTIKVTADIVHEIKRKTEAVALEKMAQEEKYPRFKVSYENNASEMNGKVILFDQTSEEVVSDLNCIGEYFAGFDVFFGDTCNAKYEYFKMLNFMFMAPFIARLRYVANKWGFPIFSYPYYAIIHGKKSAGKTEFVDTVQMMMFGKALGRMSAEVFTKTSITKLLDNATEVPLHINDISRKRFTTNCSEIIKCDDERIDLQHICQPVFIMTTNDIDNLTSDLAKRVVFTTVDITQNNVEAVSRKKKLYDNRKKMGTAFYREYLKRMIPQVMEMMQKMEIYESPEDGSESWNPDLFHLSSITIRSIYNDFGIETPDFVREVGYVDYFSNNALTKSVIERICRDYKHNRKAFKVITKEKQLVYVAGEHNYDANHVSEILPEALNAKVSGNKVIMDLDAAEAIFGIRFRRNIFGR